MNRIEIHVIYDGGCPLCRASVHRLRPRGQETRFVLIDARQDSEQRRLLVSRGFDLNDGIVIDRGDGYCSGAAAVHALALLHGGDGLLDRFAVWCFGSRRRADRAYPVFRACRRLLLFALRRNPLL